MQRLEALRLLEAKLATIEQDHEAELTQNEGLREEADARAEARLSAEQARDALAEAEGFGKNVSKI